jgi:hypothetical protein
MPLALRVVDNYSSSKLQEDEDGDERLVLSGRSGLARVPGPGTLGRVVGGGGGTSGAVASTGVVDGSGLGAGGLGGGGLVPAGGMSALTMARAKYAAVNSMNAPLPLSGVGIGGSSVGSGSSGTATSSRHGRRRGDDGVGGGGGGGGGGGVGRHGGLPSEVAAKLAADGREDSEPSFQQSTFYVAPVPGYRK